MTSLKIVTIPVQTLEEIVLRLQSKESELKLCKQQLAQLQANSPEFQARGVQSHNETKSEKGQLECLKSDPKEPKSEKNQLERAKSDPNAPKSEKDKSRNLNRAQSEPEPPNKDQGRKTSNPEIFLFPDLKHQHEAGKLDKSQGNALQHQSRLTLFNNGGGDGMPEQSSVTKSTLSENGIMLHQQPNATDLLNQNLSSIPFHVKSMVHGSGSPGVSELYFNNLINELVKTKRCIQKLQIQQKLDHEDRNEMEKMRSEIQQLRLNNQHLHRENDQLQRQAKYLAEQESSFEKPVAKDDSFEYDSVDEINKSHDSFTQTETSLDDSLKLRALVEELKKQNEVLMKERKSFCQGSDRDRLEAVTKDNSEMKRDLAELNESYNGLKSSVKILSTCLQEEKVRNKQIDGQLKQKNLDLNKQSEQLGNLRQQYEMLLAEKNAFEKSLLFSSESCYQTPMGIPADKYYSGWTHSAERQALSGRRNSDDRLVQSGGIQASDQSPIYSRSYSGDRPVPPDSNLSSDRPKLHIQQQQQQQRVPTGGTLPSPPQLRSNRSDPGLLPFRNSSSNQLPMNISPNSQVLSRIIYPANNLSPQPQEERAPSNLLIPKYTSTPENAASTVYRAPFSSSCGEYIRASVTTDTQEHQELQCPACLQTFQIETSYLNHLEKCIE